MNHEPTTLANPAPFLPWLNRAALRHWTFHVCVSAAPSFVFMAQASPRWPCVVGMLLGIGFFIVLYTALARFTYPDVEPANLWRRAIRLGTRIRTGCALLALPSVVLFVHGSAKWPFFLFLPDYLAGMVAWSITEHIGRAEPVRWLRILLTGPDPGIRRDSVWLGDMGSVIPTFLTTVIEGFLLSGLLFLIAFVCLWVLEVRARRVASMNRGAKAATRAT